MKPIENTLKIYKNDFPLLENNFKDENKIIYLDHAATTQKPIQVVKKIEEYYKNNPIATSITVSNIKENDEEETLYFDANWLFEDFKAKNHDDFLITLQSWRSDTKYACQCKREVLVNYGLRNNRYSKPIVVFHYA